MDRRLSEVRGIFLKLDGKSGKNNYSNLKLSKTPLTAALIRTTRIPQT